MRANKIQKAEELWSKTRDLIRPSTENSSEEYIKIKFNLDDGLALNKTIEIPSMIIVVRAVFHENNKYYPQIFLEESLWKLQITDLKERNQKAFIMYLLVPVIIYCYLIK